MHWMAEWREKDRDNLNRDADDYIIFTRLDRLLSTTGGS